MEPKTPRMASCGKRLVGWTPLSRQRESLNKVDVEPAVSAILSIAISKSHFLDDRGKKRLHHLT
jgi:hypothetical protein